MPSRFPKPSQIYQIKVSLREIEPLIRRRIQVWGDSTLAQLHRVLQIVMGWEDCHLHDFIIGHDPYNDGFEAVTAVSAEGCPLVEMTFRLS